MDIVRKIMIYTLIFLIVLFVCIIRFIVKFNKEIRYANRRFVWSRNREESLYWKGELRAIYWSFIPGLSPERVKKIQDWLEDDEEEEEVIAEDGIMRLLMPSFLGIALCAVCLAGGSYAWFTASTSTPTQMIQTANFDVKAVVREDTTEGDGSEITPTNGEYTLEENKTYQIELTATGNASTGYCVIKPNPSQESSVEWHTQQIESESDGSGKIVFYIVVTQETTITIQAQWGTSTKNLQDSKTKAGFADAGSYLWDGSSLKAITSDELTTYLNDLAAKKNEAVNQQSSENNNPSAIDVDDDTTQQTGQGQGTTNSTVPDKSDSVVPNDGSAADNATSGETTKPEEGTDQSQTPSEEQGEGQASESGQNLE